MSRITWFPEPINECYSDMNASVFIHICISFKATQPPSTVSTPGETTTPPSGPGSTPGETQPPTGKEFIAFTSEMYKYDQAYCNCCMRAKCLTAD